MVSLKQWQIINVSLGIVAVLLGVHFVGVDLPSAGEARAAVIWGEPLCVVQYDGEYTELQDMARCCLEARQQLQCVPVSKTLSSGTVQWSCQTGKRTVEYLLNSKAYYSCRGLPIWGGR